MDEFLGPRDRNNELTANEELEILEAYQSAERIRCASERIGAS